MRDGGLRNDRRETDTEHSFHLAMAAWYLSGFFPKYNQELLLKFALAHDLVEIHAGDVMAIGRTDEQQSKKDQDEEKALIQIKNDWPDFADMTKTIERYESQQDPEAVFVKALDKIMPILHQLLTKGKTWKHWDMHRDEVITQKDKKTAPSAEVNRIWKDLRKIIFEHDEYFNPGKV